MAPYTRRDVLRILRISPRQLQAWERASLVIPRASYSFQDLIQLGKLRDLRALRISAASIRASVSAMRAVSGMLNPLIEAGTARDGSRLVFRHSGAVMEPIARQFVFDFDPQHTDGIAAMKPPAVLLSANPAATTQQTHFAQAVHAEERGDTAAAAALYEQILAAIPDHAAACINLGTIHYNKRNYLRAEELYRRATVVDPRYALAHFDLGNVLDELQRLPEAIAAYSAAIRLAPAYGDAHYNLALTYERCGERRKALHHWTAYLKFDRTGPWAAHARSQRRKILDREKLSIVARGPLLSGRQT